ncbi:Retrovirus-related Pol polyprotein from transposon opus, partial [Mucuna pruriens]
MRTLDTIIENKEKIVFMPEGPNYYKVMSFSLKNTRATYQRLIDKVFTDHIGRNLEVRKYNMRMNLDKCMFEVQGGKFLGFILTHKGIEANPNKCGAIINIKSPRNMKECSGGAETRKEPRPRVLHYQSTTRDRNSVSNDRKVSVSSSHINSTTTTLLPLQHNSCPHRPPDSVGTIETRARKEDDYVVSRAIRVLLVVQAKGRNQDPGLGGPLVDIIRGWFVQPKGRRSMHHLGRSRTCSARTFFKAEYETLFACLDLGLEVGVRKVLCNSDSQLVMEHIKCTYQVKDPLLLRFYYKVLNMLQNFNMFEKKIHFKGRQHACRHVVKTHHCQDKSTLNHPPQDGETPAIDESRMLSTKTIGWEWMTLI